MQTHGATSTEDAAAAAASKVVEKKGRMTFDPAEYSLRKRLPAKWPKRKNDVYVTRKTHFVAQLERCCKLLDAAPSSSSADNDDGEMTTTTELYIHGLGAAVSRAIHLALQIKAKYQGSVEVDVSTATANFIDDLVPEVDDLEPETRTRSNSAIHIRVFRPLTPAAH